MIRSKTLILLVNFGCLLSQAQTAFIGDRFGGRLWYYPTNFSVGSYSAHTVCGDSQQLYSWGSNAHGELGFSNVSYANKPIRVEGMSNINYYSAGYVAGAVKKDGTGWVWGELFNKPTKVIDDVKYIDAGDKSVCFIKKDGTIWSVGQNFSGCFGNGEAVGYHREPQKMLNIDNAVRVANGSYTTQILLSTGKVMACGYNWFLGLGVPNNREIITSPIEVSGLENIVAIASSRHVNIALDQKGDVYIWGYGHGNWSGESSVRKLDGLSNIVAISARNDGAHLMALDSSGNCYAWGHNYYSQLGTQDYSNKGSPTLVATNVIDILAGESFSYIVKDDWSLWCSGSNHGGSIWLDKNITSSNKFIRILYPDVDLGICQPRYADFSLVNRYEVEICEGDSLVLSNIVAKVSGTYSDTFSSVLGFDSIDVFTLNVKPTHCDALYFTICSGDSVSINGEVYNNSGIYRDTFSNRYGCDSIINITINVLPKSFVSHEVHLCPNASYTEQSKIYEEDGLFYDTLTNQFGCDSIRQIIIITEDDYSFEDFVTICPYDSFTYQDKLFQQKDDYTFKYKTTWGCDSNYTLYLDTFTDNSCYYGECFIPNAFTPNGDEKNNKFRAVGKNIVEVSMSIYNRWGELVYRETGIEPHWDGSRIDGVDCAQGTYFYTISATSLEGVKKDYRGTVMLVK